jgi:hypothetical protein
MKTFEKDYKVNFVDDNNVLVGFDNGQCCCESFGWIISRKVPVNTEDDEGDYDTEGYNFDTSFFKEPDLGDEYMDCGGMVTFRLTKAGGDVLFLSLYNSHNGYYSHGFEMEVGGTTLHSGSL